MWEAIAGGIAGGLIDGGMGMIFGGNSQRRQARYQKVLMNYQHDLNKQMALFNQAQALQMWEATGYEAQRKQMEKAGLNIGLMYGGGGQGGSTAGAGQGGAVSGGSAGMPAMGMGISGAEIMRAAKEMELLNAQKANIEEDTRKKQAEAKQLQAQTGLTFANTVAQEMENQYNQETGYLNRRQQEAANIYKTEVEGKMTQTNLEQAPTYLKNELQKTILEGQRIAILAKEAETHAEQLRVYERVAAMERKLRQETAELQRRHEKQEGHANRNTNEYNSAKGRDMQRAGMAQQDEHFYVDQTLRVIKDGLRKANPWFND